jgi:hypothetical protein
MTVKTILHPLIPTEYHEDGLMKKEFKTMGKN